MGKISLGKGAKRGPMNPLSLPPMQTLKPLSEVILVQDSPVQASQMTVKKYVSPLSLSWKRQTAATDTNNPSCSPETAPRKKSPVKVANDCQPLAEAAGSASHAQVTPTQSNKPNRSRKSSGSDEFGSAESGSKYFRLSEGAFNTSRSCVASTPIASKLMSSDGSDCEKQNSGENSLGEYIKTLPIVDSEACTIPRKKKKSKKKDHSKLTTESPANDHLPEDSASSCIITSVNVQEKETISLGLNEVTCLPNRNRTIKQGPCEIIDLDMTNDAKEDNAIELLAIKKLPKKPVEIIDLSNTLEGFRTAPTPSANDTIIVIDDDPPTTTQRRRRSRKTASKDRDYENKKKSRKSTNASRLFKLQPHPGLIKKKEKQRNKKKKTANMLTQKCSNLQDEICFLGTGISLRPPKTANGNAGSGHGAIPPQPHTVIASAAAGSSTQNAQLGTIPPPSIFGSNFDNPNNVPQTGLRPIVIDGSNVAMGHGKTDKVFSSKGIEICINYFLKRGHKVYCFIPLFRKSDPCTRDRHILEALEEQGHLICTPSRYVGCNTIVPYDDRYIVQIAAELGGVIISRDNFRDLIAENPAFKETIQQRTLMYTWVGDIIMFPTDPFGRCNVNLDRMLRF